MSTMPTVFDYLDRLRDRREEQRRYEMGMQHQEKESSRRAQEEMEKLGLLSQQVGLQRRQLEQAKSAQQRAEEWEGFNSIVGGLARPANELTMLPGGGFMPTEQPDIVRGGRGLVATTPVDRAEIEGRISEQLLARRLQNANKLRKVYAPDADNETWGSVVMGMITGQHPPKPEAQEVVGRVLRSVLEDWASEDPKKQANALNMLGLATRMGQAIHPQSPYPGMAFTQNIGTKRLGDYISGKVDAQLDGRKVSNDEYMRMARAIEIPKGMAGFSRNEALEQVKSTLTPTGGRESIMDRILALSANEDFRKGKMTKEQIAAFIAGGGETPPDKGRPPSPMPAPPILTVPSLPGTPEPPFAPRPPKPKPKVFALANPREFTHGSLSDREREKIINSIFGPR